MKTASKNPKTRPLTKDVERDRVSVERFPSIRRNVTFENFIIFRVFSAVDEIKGIQVIFDVQNYHKRELLQACNYIFILLLYFRTQWRLAIFVCSDLMNKRKLKRDLSFSYLKDKVEV